MSGRAVAVTGLGLVTPAGFGAAATWEHFLGGGPTARPDPWLAGLNVDFSCPVDEYDAAGLLGGRLARRLDRFAQLAVLAAREAVADARLDPAQWDGTRVGVVLGVSANSVQSYRAEYARLEQGRADQVSPLMLPRSIPNMAAGEVSLDLGALGPSLVTSTACASGTTALALACDLVRAGTCDLVLAGGTDSPRFPMVATAFDRLGALSRRGHDPAGASRPFDADRDGFVLGEGAGVLVLERAEHARARGVRPRAHLAGHGSAADGYHFTAPHPDGAGLARALGTALADAGLAPYEIGHVNAHGTGTALNDVAEAAALRQVFLRPPPVTANKSVIGHTMGAAGAIEAALTVLALQNRLIPPTANLDRMDERIELDVVTKVPRPLAVPAAVSVSCGFGGQNAAVVLTAA
ncbi:beta-ketoacyl-[acyl-carrier-protein] synthase family protein [Kitasatospora sp. RG8]|uniref:beta-ketoacyl-[acyl-carrier-protein] synthase family protein n=1 Tax=Kitasatospora sp. RG8 TaxID=2820815 RepID=UPI001AE0A3B1|nr:beta-ketoacyl-[acyl-carrier-protein] synthase family protein [Kitasatospora sp. RG8]MBP0453365.1 beta-ketoacyl-[acyl-carrier-protein] synthase family protein [Kitasatospora sp. RG8]